MPANYTIIRYANKRYAESAAKSVAAILASAQALGHAAAPLRPEAAGSVFAKREVVSSDPHAVAATAKNGMERRTVRLQIEQTAAAQRNSGASFVKLGPTSLYSGTNRLKLEMNGNTTAIDFYVRSNDTHEQALFRIKNAINASNAGIRAWIRTDDEDRVSLAVAAKESGTSHAFTISDELGNAAAASGIAAVDVHAANAMYRVDGGAPITSQSNEISLENGDITATLKLTTSQPVSLQVRTAHSAIASSIGALAAAYNRLTEAFAVAEGITSPLLQRGIAQSLDSQTLGQIGITVYEDGTIGINDSMLHASITGRGAEVELTIGHLAGKLERAAQRLEATPAEALIDRGNPDFRRYVNYRESGTVYSQLPFDGILLNRFM